LNHQRPVDVARTLASLRDFGDALHDTNNPAVVTKSNMRSPARAVRWASTVRPEVEMAVDLLKASEAARRLEIPTKELLRLVYYRKIGFVMVKGIAHVPDDAIEEFHAKGL
jgi:hypothetical protein